MNPPKTDDENLLTMDQAIKQLKTTRPTFYRWLKSGKVKGMKVGRQWRFRSEDLDRFLRGEQPRLDLPVSPDPLMHELGKALQQAGAKPQAESADDPIAEIVNRMIRLAIVKHASDLHLHPDAALKPQPGNAVLRLRVDGALHPAAKFDLRLLPAVVKQFKMLTACRVDINTKPQDGRLLIDIDGETHDLRINYLPAIHGESVTVRLLHRRTGDLSLDVLPLRRDDRRVLREAVESPHGLIIVTGPVGSGKTTTLYCALQHRNKPDTKIVTVEDPVEYILPGIVQTQVNSREGVNFEISMRSIFRTDPDVIMLGEIRSGESMQLACQGVLNGYLVMTSMHTNNAATALRRMMDIGVDPFIVGETVRLIVAQRLVRCLCPHCRKPTDLNNTQRQHARTLASDGGIDWQSLPDAFCEPVGCDRCNHVGYYGRTMLTEMLRMSGPISVALREGTTDAQVTAMAVSDGMTTMTADGVRRAANGEVCIEEVLRIASTMKP